MNLQNLGTETLDWIKSQLQFDHLEIAFTELDRVDPTSRQLLRRACLDHWPLASALALSSKEEFLNLKNLPQLREGDLSLSHSPPWGWAAWSHDTGHLGIDAEPLNRSPRAAVQRISKTAELDLCPASPTHLWVAKEAAFKAFSKSLRIRLVSDVQIQSWQTLGTDRWQLKAQCHLFPDVSFRGLVLSINDCIFSIFKSHLNFPPGTPIKL